MWFALCSACGCFTALLRRELLSVAYRVFDVVKKKAGRVAEGWTASRREFLLMTDLLIFAHAGRTAPLATAVFASEAQGAGEVSARDCGGFGVVATNVSENLAHYASRRVVVKKKEPARALLPMTPSARLPLDLFRPSWLTVAAGRWHTRDHITLGEARTLARIAQVLASRDVCHG